mmetsp:Transcript_39102/g.80059  ORF Transcript_39102/g.80059 Transcript_39102/m.80059 type:complete len:226 (+) Transcript_39102:633-1310(+)
MPVSMVMMPSPAPSSPAAAMVPSSPRLVVPAVVLFMSWGVLSVHHVAPPAALARSPHHSVVSHVHPIRHIHHPISPPRVRPAAVPVTVGHQVSALVYIAVLPSKRHGREIRLDFFLCSDVVLAHWRGTRPPLAWAILPVRILHILDPHQERFCLLLSPGLVHQWNRLVCPDIKAPILGGMVLGIKASLLPNSHCIWCPFPFTRELVERRWFLFVFNGNVGCRSFF